MGKYACKRSREQQAARLHKRVVTSLDTILRELLGLPAREGLCNPRPVSREACIDYLTGIVAEVDHVGLTSSSTFTCHEPKHDA